MDTETNYAGMCQVLNLAIDLYELISVQGDLGQATADEIKYTVFPEQQRRPSNFAVPRQCDRRDTKEAEIASQNKLQLSNWNSTSPSTSSVSNR